MNNEQLTRCKSFTLIELLVGITIFAILMSAMIGVLVSGIKVQRQFLSQQDALNQLSFVIEYISRALRMATRDNGKGCLSSPDLNYEVFGTNNSGVEFINHLQLDACQQFFLSGTTLQYNNGTETLALASPKLEITALKFEVSGASKSELPNLQPRVTIFIEARPKGFPSTIKLQTTISQRNLDEN